MKTVQVDDLLEITRETVGLYRRTRWELNFVSEHIGQQVRYGGEHQTFEEFGSKHFLIFQTISGRRYTPNCPLSIITKMREAYLITQGEIDNA
jgi:hypothetical protein